MAALLSLGMVFAGVSISSGQAVGDRVSATDLPAEFMLMLPEAPAADLRWTLIGSNPKAEDEAATHPELNAVAEIWHCPLAHGRHAFRISFTRPFVKGSHVVHLYVKADDDDDTGRVAEGALNGVDYMLTLSGEAAGTTRDVWNCYTADGGSHPGVHMTVIQDSVLYLSADMTVRQRDGASVFDYLVVSYVRKQTDEGWRAVASSRFGFATAVAQPEPAPSSAPGRAGFILNPDMTLMRERLPGWSLVTGNRPLEAGFSTADADERWTLAPLYAREGLAQTVTLSPGHYLLRGLARTDVFQIHLFADRARIPLEVSDEPRWTELPFYVPRSDGPAEASVTVGFRYVARPATGNASRLPARLSVERVELLRLGDTVLTPRWLDDLPVNPIHRLRLINEQPAWERPGKVVFQDTFIGTELWMMTQGGRIDHSYVGHPDFSRNGAYLHVGARRAPRGLLRTDGTARYLNDAWKGMVWPFPWMRKRLPAETDPADWVVASRQTAEVELDNVVTGEKCRLRLPTRAGWESVHYPGMTGYGGRGPRIEAITHETVVWLSEDRKRIALSTVDGEAFRRFPVRSISENPEADVLSPSMSSVGGKGGDNWRDAVDREGNRYFLFELNRDHLPDHPTNPYQVWALCMTGENERGPLRVISHPAATVTEFVTSRTGMTKQPSAKWWDLAAGFPWSGDNAILRLENDTLVHMSSLGMHSSCLGGSTVSVNDPHSGKVRFVGRFHKLDRITWPHEFRRDRDYAVVASHVEPASPLVMLDLAHDTMWTVAMTNFHDYAMRYRTRWDKTAYHKPMFRPAPTFSPDYTKVSFFSSMLTGDHPERKWGDLYVAVVRYPQPPVNLRLDGNALLWDRPHHDAEIKGFRLYRSEDSGGTVERVGSGLLSGTRIDLPPESRGCYAVTSVEHSGLESRVFSNEVRVGPGAGFRHYYQAENGALTAPMVPFFDPRDAAGAYAVAVTDPELTRKTRLAEGLTGAVTLPITIAAPGPVRIAARVRGMSRMECATYTTGWPASDNVASGTFTLRIDGRDVGGIVVDARAEWQWSELDAGTVTLPAGTVEVTFATAAAGIALDAILVTDDVRMAPAGRGRMPEVLAGIPKGLRTADFGREDAGMLGDNRARVKLAWEPMAAPHGVAHYNVYRAHTESFPAEPEHLLGSPLETVFYDCDLRPGETVYYRVRGVDAWGNQSAASQPFAVTVETASVHAAFTIRPQPGPDQAGTFTFDATDSRADVGQLTSWQWSFGDGKTASGKTVTHTFENSGAYMVTLTCGTDRDEWATTEQSLYVQPRWLRNVLANGAVWVEAEAKTGEGGGESRTVSGRINASDKAVTYWEKDIGHWLEWQVTVPQAGEYGVVLKYATGSPRALRDCTVDGQIPGEGWERIAFPGTGGFSSSADNWRWHLLKDDCGRPLRMRLTDGMHTLRMSNLECGMALDAFVLVPVDALPPSL